MWREDFQKTGYSLKHWYESRNMICCINMKYISNRIVFTSVNVPPARRIKTAIKTCTSLKHSMGLKYNDFNCFDSTLLNNVFWVHQTLSSVKALVSYLLVFTFCNIMDKVKVLSNHKGS